MKKEQRKLQFKDILLIILPSFIAFFLEIISFFAYISISAIYRAASTKDLVDAGPLFLVKYLLFAIVFTWWYLASKSVNDESKSQKAKKAGSKSDEEEKSKHDRATRIAGAVILIAIGVTVGLVNRHLYTGAEETTLFLKLVMIIMAPFAEEILFRGLIQSNAKKVFSPTAAIIIQAVLYGIFLLNPIQSLCAIPLGIYLGFVTQKKDGNLIVPILIHTAMNILFYI